MYIYLASNLPRVCCTANPNKGSKRWYFWPASRFARWTYQEDLSVQLARDDLFDQPVQEGLVFHPFHLDLKVWAERRSHYNWLTKDFKIHLLVLKYHEIKIFLLQGMWRHTKPMCVRGNIEAILRMPQHPYRSCSFAIVVPGCHLGLGNSPLSRPTHVHLKTLKIDLLWNWKLKRQWTSQQFIARVTWRGHFGGKQHDFKWFPLLISFYPSFWIWWCCTSSVRCISSRRYPRSGGGAG